MDQSTVRMSRFGTDFCFQILSRDGDTAVICTGGIVAADLLDLSESLGEWIPAQISGNDCHIRAIHVVDALHATIEIRAKKLSLSDINKRLQRMADALTNPGHKLIARRVLDLRQHLVDFESGAATGGDFRDIPNVKAELQALYDSTPKFKAGPLKEFVDKLCLLIGQLDSTN